MRAKTRHPGVYQVGERSFLAVFDAASHKGRRKQVWLSGFTSAKAAASARRDAMLKVERHAYAEPSKDTMAEFLHKWLDRIAPVDAGDHQEDNAIRAGTWSSYRDNAELHLIPRIGDIRVRDLSPERLEQLFKELLTSGRANGKGGLSRTTVRYIRAILHKAFADGMRLGIVDSNPVDRVRPPSQRKPEIQRWGAEELFKFLSAIQGHEMYEVFHTLAALQGCGVAKPSGSSGGTSISTAAESLCAALASLSGIRLWRCRPRPTPRAQ